MRRPRHPQCDPARARGPGPAPPPPSTPTPSWGRPRWWRERAGCTVDASATEGRLGPQGSEAEETPGQGAHRPLETSALAQPLPQTTAWTASSLRASFNTRLPGTFFFPNRKGQQARICKFKHVLINPSPAPPKERAPDTGLVLREGAHAQGPRAPGGPPTALRATWQGQGAGLRLERHPSVETAGAALHRHPRCRL